MKRYRELQEGEQEQRKRLEDVMVKLERIRKGTSDCDGYTSNTEEATFIETLLNELPEIQVKQEEAVEECNQIYDSLEDLQKEVEMTTQVFAPAEEVTSKVSESLEL